MVEKIVQKDGEERPGMGNLLFKLPKHIKQIGLGGSNPEIYIEDYAEGYLRRLAGSDYTECRVAVLVGEFVKTEEKRYVFVRGAIEAENVIVNKEIHFTSDVWASVYEKIKRYFPQYEAVGWFLGGPEFMTEVTDEIRQMHVDWFGGRDRVLYRVDPIEKDAGFYLYEKGELKRWPGYCIYYEKNEEMQDYLVAGTPLSVDDGYTEPVLEKVGKRVGRKEEQEEIRQGEEAEKEKELVQIKEIPPEKAGEKKTGNSGSGHGLGYAAAVALLAIGAFALREKELGQVGNADVPTSILTPTPMGYNQTEEKDIVQTNAEVLPTVSVGVWDSVEQNELEREFVPITEEPYVPGEEKEDATVTDVPETEPPKLTEAPTPEPVVSTDTMKLYVVQNGDTLAGICRAFYGSISRMEEVKGINQIPDENWIYAGQELYLP